MSALSATFARAAVPLVREGIVAWIAFALTAPLESRWGLPRAALPGFVLLSFGAFGLVALLTEWSETRA